VSLKRLGLLLLGPLFLGAGLRFTHAWSCFHSRTPHALPQWAYYETGLGLLSYKTYTPDIVNLQPKAWRGPLFPAFIALAESLWKHPLPGHVYLAQALLSTSAIPLAFALGCLLVSPLAGFWASLWMALDFGQIASVTSLNVHGFYSLCILALAACLALWAEKPGWKASALCGLCLGASLLCRTAHYLLIGLLPLAAVFWSWDLRQGLRRASLLAFFAALCLAPFLLRDFRQFGRLVWLDTGWGSYNLLTAAMGETGTARVEHALEKAEALEPGFRQSLSGDELEEQVRLRRLALRSILSRPLSYLRGFLERLRLFWEPIWPALLLSLLALVLNPKNRGLQALFLVAASFVGYGVTGMYEEYPVAAMPVLSVLAGCGLASLFPSRPPREPRLAWALPAFAGLFLFFYAALLGFFCEEWRRYGWPSRGEALERACSPPAPRILEFWKQGVVASGGRWSGALSLTNMLLRLPTERLPEVLPGLDLMVRGLSNGLKAQALAQRGQIRMRLKDARAWEDFREALGVDPESFAAHRAAVEYLIRNGEARKALPYARRLKSLSRDKPRSHKAQAESLWANLLAALSLDPKADNELEAALSESPRDFAALKILCERRLSQGRLGEALKLADRLLDLELAPHERAQALAQKAIVRLRLKDKKGGREDFEKALRQDGRVCEQSFGLDRGRMDLIYFNLCLGRFPEDPKLFLDRGVARYLRGESQGALADLQEALRLKPDSLEAGLSLATVLRSQKRRREALEVLAKALARTRGREGEPAFRKALSLRDLLAREISGGTGGS